jgi:hypothetical protein
VYENDLESILSLLTDEEDGAWNIQEIYHAFLEYIKSGQAISDMGHPDFMRGARGAGTNANYSSFRPSSTIFKLVSSCSKYLNNYDMSLIWYRDLSTWEKYCKYVVELKQIRYFQKHFTKAIKSYKSYIGRKTCPACGTARYNDISDKTDQIFLENRGSNVFIDCRRCGKYVLSHSSFNELDSFEKKAKLFVSLVTRQNKYSDYGSPITPKILKMRLE